MIKCKAALNQVADRVTTRLYWVPGHSNIRGNCVADDLARAGTLLPSINTALDVGMPLATARGLINQHYLNVANERWVSEITCVIARQTWPNIDPKRSTQLISANRKSISTVSNVLTGHCILGRHAARLGLPYNDYCRSCDSEEEEETVSHLLCHCPALSRRRFKHFGAHFLDDLTELSTVNIRDIARFISESNWFPVSS